MKMKMSLQTKNLIGSVICGTFWFLSGVFGLWDSFGFKLANAVALIGAGASMLTVILVGAVEGDEMSEIHTYKAKARTYDSILMGFLIFSLVGAIQNLTNHRPFIANWHAWTMMFVGFMQVLFGIHFLIYERNGD